MGARADARAPGRSGQASRYNSGITMARTLFEKIWDTHVVATPSGRSPILYIDLHLVHEVTSPQAFDGLRGARCGNQGARWRPSTTMFRPNRGGPRSRI